MIVAERDSFTCVLCTNPFSDIHHYVPRSKGGRNTPENLVALCRACHMRIHRQLPPPNDWCRGADCDRYCIGTDSFGVAHCWQGQAEYRICEYLSDYYAEELQNPLTKWNYWGGL